MKTKITWSPLSGFILTDDEGRHALTDGEDKMIFLSDCEAINAAKKFLEDSGIKDAYDVSIVKYARGVKIPVIRYKIAGFPASNKEMSFTGYKGESFINP